MCKKEKCCEKPENLKGKPEECSPEQIKKCHGTSGKHPCVPKPDRPPAYSEGGPCHET